MPEIQYTAREVRSGLLFWAFAERRTAAASAVFAARIQQHLDRYGVSLRDLVWQTDNGSEFINWHLKAWCEGKGIQLTRGRPYKKDDNAHVEQKNWTHVRKLLGWDRYDTAAAVEAMNDLYRHEPRRRRRVFTFGYITNGATICRTVTLL